MYVYIYIQRERKNLIYLNEHNRFTIVDLVLSHIVCSCWALTGSLLVYKHFNKYFYTIYILEYTI